jgi:hypothetical protein
MHNTALKTGLAFKHFKDAAKIEEELNKFLIERKVGGIMQTERLKRYDIVEQWVVFRLGIIPTIMPTLLPMFLNNFIKKS